MNPLAARPWQLVRALGLLFAAAAVGWLISEGFVGHRKKGSVLFAHTPGYTVWAALVVTQTILWAAAAALGYWRLRGTASPRHAKRAALIYLLLAVFAGVVFGLSSQLLNAKVGAAEPGHSWRILSLDLLALVAGGFPAVGLLSVWARADDLARSAAVVRNPQIAIAKTTELWNDLRFYLATLGAMVAVVTLASSAISQAVRAAPASAFPDGQRPVTQSPAMLLIYSLAWSAMVAALWAPGFYAVRRLGAVAVERMHPLPASPMSSAWPAILGTRDTVSLALHATDSALDNLRAGLLILTPLVAGLIGLLLPK